MDLVLQDVRHAFRGLVREPAFAVISILTLALGMGATTAMFGVVRGVLLAPLPYSNADARVMVWSRWTGWDKTWVSPIEVQDYRQRIAQLPWRGGMGKRPGQSHRRRAARTRRRRPRHRQHIRRARRAAAARSRIPAWRRCDGHRRARRRAEPRTLAAALRRRSVSGRPLDGDRRREVPDRRNHAEGIQAADRFPGGFRRAHRALAAARARSRSERARQSWLLCRGAAGTGRDGGAGIGGALRARRIADPRRACTRRRCGSGRSRCRSSTRSWPRSGRRWPSSLRRRHSCCSSRAPTSRTCCSPALNGDAASLPSALRSVRDAGGMLRQLIVETLLICAAGGVVAVFLAWAGMRLRGRVESRRHSPFRRGAARWVGARLCRTPEHRDQSRLCDCARGSEAPMRR